MRTLRMLSLIVLSALCAVAAEAQSPTQGWRIWVYAETLDSGRLTGRVLTLGEPGLLGEMIAPPKFYDFGQAGVIFPDQVLLSDDGTLLAGFFRADNGPTVRLADLSAGTCCVRIAEPPGVIESITSGVFRPGTSTLAVSLVTSEAEPVWAVVALLDGRSGQLSRGLDLSQALAAVRESLPDFPFLEIRLGAWVEGQLAFTPFAPTAQAPMFGNWFLWDPDTNTIGQSSQTFHFGADLLPATGEHLAVNAPENDALILISATQGQSIPVPEALRPARPGSAGVGWAANGEAAVLYDRIDGGAAMLFRDGRITPLPNGLVTRWVGGTPDGFLTVEAGTDGAPDRLILTSLANGNIASTIVVDAPSTRTRYVLLAADPPLGTGFEPRPFVVPVPTALPSPTPIPATSTPVVAAPLVCGGMTTRLVVGMFTRVTPGEPNNLRAAPSLSAEILNRIPGGSPVSLRSGPTCADGLLWWEVDALGQIGWTVEGVGGVYFLEPAA